MIVKGHNRDTAWFAITDDVRHVFAAVIGREYADSSQEWLNRKAALVKWMDPSNFDGEGKQLNDLASLRATS